MVNSPFSVGVLKEDAGDYDLDKNEPRPISSSNGGRLSSLYFVFIPGSNWSDTWRPHPLDFIFADVSCRQLLVSQDLSPCIVFVPRACGRILSIAFAGLYNYCCVTLMVSGVSRPIK